MAIVISLLLLLLNLVILGAIYWGLTVIIGVIPFIDASIKTIIITILKVIVTIIAIIWVAQWIMVVLAGSANFGFPSFIPYPRGRIR